MHADELLAIVRRRPFIPFRLHVSDGSSYDIKHPDMIMVSRRSAVIGLPGDPAQPVDLFVTVALVHVSRIEELPAAAAAK